MLNEASTSEALSVSPAERSRNAALIGLQSTERVNVAPLADEKLASPWAGYEGRHRVDPAIVRNHNSIIGTGVAFAASCTRC